ncbi:hypothetical protein BLNAU_5853 [Blattamonas nauphoetae]|uniref:Uncharacterized protein n=1 Tax=Blattamonas nauphoetae TaxID=2049346 RepID=A0ABQ9Y6C0_9EUKA|nr:hypothetical protein BLNAU_5853 [Blattamonas nauphoetae]
MKTRRKEGGKEGEKEETKSSEERQSERKQRKMPKGSEAERTLLSLPNSRSCSTRSTKCPTSFPTSFYVRVVVGIVLIISGAAFFYVMCIFALTHSAKYYNSVTLTSYKCVVAMQARVLALEMANSINYEVPGIYTTVPFATGRWIDSRHLSSDMPLIQDLMLEEINYYNAINILANQGSKSANVFPTGDVDFDGLAVEPTVKAGSKVPDIMSETRECFENDADDCDYEDRVYGMKGQSFSGLQALVSKHLESAKLIATNPDPYSGIMGSMVIWDMRGGFRELLEAVTSEMKATINTSKILLIVSFIVAISLDVLAFLAFIFPTKSILASVASGSEALKDIDPAADTADRTGMGQAAWKEEYTCDSLRFDHQHKTVLLALAATCGCLDSTMEVKAAVDEFMERTDDATKDQLIKASLMFINKEQTTPTNQTKKRTLANKPDSKEALLIAKFARAGKPIPAQTVQNLIQLYTQWLTEHVTKVDRYDR